MPTKTITNDGTVTVEIGETFGNLRVEGYAARVGNERRFTVRCQVCNSQGVASYSKLRNGAAKCLNASCGKTARKRERLEESEAIIAQRKAELEAAQRKASAARMEYESDGHERQLSFVEKQGKILRERRDKEERDRVEAEQRAAEAPRREAERVAAEERQEQAAAQHKRDENQRRYWAEWVQSDRDPKLFVTDAMHSARMPTKEAEVFNDREVATFMQTTPDFAEFRTPTNADKIIAYFDRNGVRIFDAAMLKAAFVRLRDLGILVKRPAPQPQSVEQPKRVNLSVAPPTAGSGPRTYTGRDYATGKERTFTQREVDRMSSLEFQRAFEIVPTVSELFTRMKGER